MPPAPREYRRPQAPAPGWTGSADVRDRGLDLRERGRVDQLLAAVRATDHDGRLRRQPAVGGELLVVLERSLDVVVLHVPLPLLHIEVRDPHPARGVVEEVLVGPVLLRLLQVEEEEL